MDTMIPVDRGGPAQPLLLARGLRKHFPLGGGLLGRSRKVVRAVDDLTERALRWMKRVTPPSSTGMVSSSGGAAVGVDSERLATTRRTASPSRSARIGFMT